MALGLGISPMDQPAVLPCRERGRMNGSNTLLGGCVAATTIPTTDARALCLRQAHLARDRSVLMLDRSRDNSLAAIRLRHQLGIVRRLLTGPIYAMAVPHSSRLEEEPGVILVADDDDGVSESLKDILEPAGHEVFVANDAGEALKVLSEHEVDVLVLDMSMPIHDGWTVLREIGDQARPVVIIYSDENFSPLEMRELFDLRPFGILPKPTTPDYILSAIGSAVAHLRMADQRRDRVADEGEHDAEERDWVADERARGTDKREHRADDRVVSQARLRQREQDEQAEIDREVRRTLLSRPLGDDEELED